MTDDAKGTLAWLYFRLLLALREIDSTTDEDRRRELARDVRLYERRIMEITIRAEAGGRPVSDVDRLRHLVRQWEQASRPNARIGGNAGKREQLDELALTLEHHLPLSTPARERTAPGPRDRDAPAADLRRGSDESPEMETTDLHARLLWACAHMPPYGAWTPGEQVRAVETLWRAALEVEAQYRALRPEVALELEWAEPEDEDADEDASAGELVQRLVAKLKTGIAPAKARARKGKPPHSKNLQAVEVVEGCRLVWQHRRRSPAPGGELKDASPFADFLLDVFTDLGIDSTPRTAMRRWIAERGR